MQQSRILNDLIKAIGVVRKVRQGAQLYGQGDSNHFLWQIISGAVRGVHYFSDGRRKIAEFYIPNEIFGQHIETATLFGAESTVDSEVGLVRWIDVQDVARNSPQLTWALSEQLVLALTRSRQHLVILGQASADQRLLEFLRALAQRMGSPVSVELPMDRRDIADHLGMVIETISRAFTELERKSLISFTSRRHIVLAASQSPRRFE